MQMNTSLNRRFNRVALWLFTIALLMAFLLSNGDVNAQDLITPSAEAPSYRLSDAKFEFDRFGRQVFSVQYTRTKEADSGQSPAISVGGKTRSGELRVLGSSIHDSSGELSISASPFGSQDMEIYFVIQTSYGKMLVSNVARVGDPGSKTKARSWTAEETKAYERSKLARTPPEGLPEKHVALESGVKLLPGMPIKAGSYAEWVDATVIRPESSGQVLVQIGQAKTLTILDREKWLAIKPETLEQGISDPKQFSTDIQVLPGSKQIIPNGANPLASNLTLPVGTPLLYDDNFRWRDVYVVKTENGEIKLRFKDHSATWDKTEPRSKFLIHDETLKQLEEPSAADKFAANVEPEKFPAKPSDRSSSARKLRLKNYPIDLQIPEDSQLVSDELTLKEGVALAACWARKWHPLTVLDENDDGSVHVRWDERSAAFDCNMKRSQLVIQNATVAELEADQAGEEPETTNGSAEELAQKLRDWTDSTGKFKIEAYYIAHTETKVTLKTAAGKEINMPFSKLSDADQELLSKIAQDGDNPFD